jgi:hypothetical protein
VVRRCDVEDNGGCDSKSPPMRIDTPCRHQEKRPFWEPVDGLFRQRILLIAAVSAACAIKHSDQLLLVPSTVSDSSFSSFAIRIMVSPLSNPMFFNLPNRDFPLGDLVIVSLISLRAELLHSFGPCTWSL